MSFKIAGGQKVALVGANGCGKTTIMNLIYGFYQPTQGKIKINDQDITQLGLKHLRKNIGFFEQNPSPIQGSIRDNIIYGAEDPQHVSNDDILAIAQRLGLGINELTLGLDTFAALDKELSGGEFQKIAILRAALKGSRIRLLDEITTHLDSQSRRSILKYMYEQSPDITTITITHHAAEILCSDYVLLIEKGQLIAHGRHYELMQHCDQYQQLVADNAPQNNWDMSTT